MTRLTGHAVRGLVFGRVTSEPRYEIEAVERLRVRVAMTLETWTLRRDAVQKGHAEPVAQTPLMSSDSVDRIRLPLAVGDDAGYACADVDRFVRRAAEAIAQAARSFHTEAVVASRLSAESLTHEGGPRAPEEPAVEPLSQIWRRPRRSTQHDLPAATPRQEDTNPARMALATAVVTVVVLLGILVAPEREGGSGGLGESDVVAPTSRGSEQAAIAPGPATVWSPGGRVGSRQELMGPASPSGRPESGR